MTRALSRRTEVCPAEHGRGGARGRRATGYNTAMLLLALALVWVVLAGLVLLVCVGMLRAGHQEDVDRNYVDD